VVPYSSAYSNSLYYFVNQRKTLNDAQTTCVSLGGHLASYRNLDEQVGAGTVACICGSDLYRWQWRLTSGLDALLPNLQTLPSNPEPCVTAGGR
jgi:hypothetical protein